MTKGDRNTINDKGSFAGRIGLWLLSAAVVSVAFAAGRAISSSLRSVRPKLLEPPDAPPAPPYVDRISIEAPPDRVYEIARRLEYFRQFLTDVDDVTLLNPSSARLVVANGGGSFEIDLEVIADQASEFFGVRVEHDGRLYGTCLIKFEGAKKDAATEVTASTRFKVQLEPGQLSVVTPVIEKEIDAYLRNLKVQCESSLTAACGQVDH